MNAVSPTLSHTSHLVYLADPYLHCREQLFFPLAIDVGLFKKK